MSKTKTPKPNIQALLEPFKDRVNIKFFPFSQIPDAVTWAERGNVSVHENYHTKKRASFHVISGDKNAIKEFCKVAGIPEEAIKASEFYRFWHVTWVPGHPQGLT